MKNIEQTMPKIYTVDNGLIDNIVGDDKSKKFENLVFLSFLQKGYEINKNIFYYSQPDNGQNLKCNNLLIITQDLEGEEKIKGKKIKFIPLKGVSGNLSRTPK